jgi:signal transduction histidine kinase
MVAPDQAQESLMLLESSSIIGCFVLDQQGYIRRTNPVFRRWLGLSEAHAAAGESIYRFLPRAGDVGLVQRAVSGGGTGQVALRLERTDGMPVAIVGDFIPFEAGGVSAVAGFFQESIGDRRLRAGMERGARLEALGSLTSGVAHDFNNLLTILIGNLSLVAEELRQQPEQLAKVEAAREAAQHGAELIKQLLAFARQEPVESQLVNPAKVIRGVAPLIERALGSRIRLELDLDEGLDPILGNPAQLESAIVNLAVNARDAISDRGCVRIQVYSHSLAASNARQIGLVPGSYLSIEVSDDGEGIPDGVIERVFEPFFTTKTGGKGSGLGLSMVKDYTDQFGGTTGLVSKPGKGTTVRLQFPTSGGKAEDSSSTTKPVAALPSGDESLVVVANDEGLRAMMNQILNVLGYRCQVAASADAVPQLARECLPDLIVVDGFDLYRSLEAMEALSDPPVRILVLETMGEEDTQASFPVLRKPFSIPDLAITVRTTLDADD